MLFLREYNIEVGFNVLMIYIYSKAPIYAQICFHVNRSKPYSCAVSILQISQFALQKLIENIVFSYS